MVYGIYNELATWGESKPTNKHHWGASHCMNHHESPLTSNRHQGTLDIRDIRDIHDQDLEEEDDPPKRGALLHGCKVISPAGVAIRRTWYDNWDGILSLHRSFCWFSTINRDNSGIINIVVLSLNLQDHPMVRKWLITIVTSKPLAGTYDHQGYVQQLWSGMVQVGPGCFSIFFFFLWV